MINSGSGRSEAAQLGVAGGAETPRVPREQQQLVTETDRGANALQLGSSCRCSSGAPAARRQQWSHWSRKQAAAELADRINTNRPLGTCSAGRLGAKTRLGVLGGGCKMSHVALPGGRQHERAAQQFEPSHFRPKREPRSQANSLCLLFHGWLVYPAQPAELPR